MHAPFALARSSILLSLSLSDREAFKQAPVAGDISQVAGRAWIRPARLVLEVIGQANIAQRALDIYCQTQL